MAVTNIERKIFEITSEEEFNTLALEVFRYQYAHNKVYRDFCRALLVSPSDANHYSRIPFLPVEFFKTHILVSGDRSAELVFSSSGTTGMQTSKHHVLEPSLYRNSFLRCFRMFFGDPQDYHLLALLPSYLEREGSSLIYMTEHLLKESNSPHSGFYLHDLKGLQEKIISLQKDERKILLLGVSFALLDMAEQYSVNHPRLQIMETGGMKGRRKELVREELHQVLTSAFGVNAIGSEYGMTELLSQAYSFGDGIFQTPPWMKVLVRDTNDPLSLLPAGRSGGISVIDLANLHSCAFIATQDLGRTHENGSFEILGRFDNSDIRGCNLMVSGV